MKKRILFVAVALTMILGLSSCAPNSVNSTAGADVPSVFVIVEETQSWRVVRHKETGVMYAVSYGSYNSGNFTLLVNADGSPMVWEP